MSESQSSRRAYVLFSAERLKILNFIKKNMIAEAKSLTEKLHRLSKTIC